MSRPKFSLTSERLARRLINLRSSGAVHWKDNFMLSPMIWFSGKESSRKVPRIQREKTNFGSSQILMEMLATLGDLWATLLDGWSSGVVRWEDNFLLSMMIWFSGKESSGKVPTSENPERKDELWTFSNHYCAATDVLNSGNFEVSIFCLRSSSLCTRFGFDGWNKLKYERNKINYELRYPPSQC